MSTSSTGSGDPNCKDTNDNQICVACYEGYFLTIGRNCQRKDPLCKTYTQNQAACDSCYPGYGLYEGQCLVESELPSQNNDVYCIKVDGSVCTECAAGYYLPDSGVCKQLNPLCKESNMRTGACRSCYPGYTLAGDTCIVAAAVTIPYCETVVGTVCVKCINGYYTDNGGCALANTLCATYDPTNGICKSCIPGYVFQQNECIYPSLGIDPNCAWYSNSFC